MPFENFDMSPSVEKKTAELKKLASLMQGETHIAGTSKYGEVFINKIDDAIVVKVKGSDGVDSRFSVTETEINAKSDLPEVTTRSRAGKDVTQEYQDMGKPKFTLDEVLSTFQKQG